MRYILTFTGNPHSVTLDGLGQDHRRLPLVVHRRRIGRIDFQRVVAAAVEPPDILIRHIGDHLQQFGIFAEEVFAGISAAAPLVGLVVTVDDLLHTFEQQAILVTRQQWIPIAPPHDLDDVPACTTKYRFKLLDNLAVAAHRPVQALQVAVDDEHQVVQLLTSGK